MINSKHRFTLEIQAAHSQIAVPVKVGDTGTKFYIALTDGGKPFIIPDGSLAMLTIHRPTGTYMELFCPIEGNTNIVYDFAQHTATAIVEGLHECEVTLYGLDGGIITTARFSMVVSARVVNRDDIEITDEDWTVIDSVAVEEARRQDRFNRALEEVDEAIEGIGAAIEEIVPPYVGENGNWFVNGKDTGTKAQGEPGVYVGSGEMPEGYFVQVDPDGEEIKNFVLSVNGIKPDEDGNIEIAAEGDVEAAVSEALQKAKESGEFTPKKGVDYFTEEDKTELVNLVINAIPVWNGEVEY